MKTIAGVVGGLVLVAIAGWAYEKGREDMERERKEIEEALEGIKYFTELRKEGRI